MSLFAHRFLRVLDDERTRPPGRYDERRSVRLDELDQPVVLAVSASVRQTGTKAEGDPSHEHRLLADAQLATRGEIDPPASLDVLGTVTKTAEVDRDDCSLWATDPGQRRIAVASEGPAASMRRELSAR